MSYSSEVLADAPVAYWPLGDTPRLVAATASSSYTTLPPEGAFDAQGDPGNVDPSVWTSSSTSTGWIRAQLDSALVVTKYAIKSEDYLSGTRNPKSWTLQGSNDGTTWTTIDTQTGITFATGETKTFTGFANSTAYLYYRLNITANNGDSFLAVHEWYLNDLMLSRFADSSGSSRHLGFYYAGATTSLLPGSTSGAAVFNGSSTRAQTVYGSWMDLTSGTITVEAWVKPTSTSGIVALIDRDDSAGRVFQFRLNAGKVEFIKTGGTGGVLGGVGVTTLSAGTVYHVAATYDGSNIRIYVNGVLDSTTAAVGSMSGATGSRLTLGAGYGGTSTLSGFYNGAMSQVAMYKSVLSGTRLSAHYTAGTTASTAASGTASLSLSASGATGATSSGTASLSLSASGSTGATASGTASLNLSATGDTVAPAAASGSASLALSAAGIATASPSGTASLNLQATAEAQAILAASGTATISLTASGSAVMGSSGSAALALSAVGTARALYPTDTSNALDGRSRRAYAIVTLTRPSAPLPPDVSYGQRVDKALALRDPTMVEGMPT